MLGSLAVAFLTLWRTFSYVRKRLSLRLELEENDPTAQATLSLELVAGSIPLKTHHEHPEHSQSPNNREPKF